MKQRVEFKTNGLKCDYCDWEDETIAYEEMQNHLNTPCPKCGENILTEEQYVMLKDIKNLSDYINNLSEEDWKLLEDNSPKVEELEGKTTMKFDTFSKTITFE